MQYLSLKSDTIEKISPRSEGKIHYRLLSNPEHTELFVVFTGNDDSGHFSDEVVSFERIEKCVEGFKPGTYVASKQFFPAFNSRSNNNCGFLAAILRAEELLAPVVDGEKRHVMQPGWDSWKASMLEEVGEHWEQPQLLPVVPATTKQKKAVANAKRR